MTFELNVMTCGTYLVGSYSENGNVWFYPNEKYTDDKRSLPKFLLNRNSNHKTAGRHSRDVNQATTSASPEQNHNASL